MLRDFFTKEKDEPLEDEIDGIYKEMHRIGVTDEEYPKMLALLERYYKLKAMNRQKPVSREAMLNIGGNLLGIAMILTFEWGHVITSKGFNQLIRPKNT